jgi:hypothetical protein
MSAPSPSLHEARTDEEQLALVFTIETPDTGNEEQLFATVKRFEPILSVEISRLVPSFLGPLFRLQKVEVQRGSVTLWVLIAGGYELISHYDNFVKSLERLKTQIERILPDVLPGVRIVGRWMSIQPLRRRLSFSRLFQNPNLIIFVLASYLVLSQAFMLIVLLRILQRVFP